MATEAECKQASREGDFINEMAHVRDLLDPIVVGQIERGHCVAGKHWPTELGGNPGYRRATITDAKRICKTVQFLINRAIAKFDEEKESS